MTPALVRLRRRGYPRCLEPQDASVPGGASPTSRSSCRAAELVDDRPSGRDRIVAPPDRMVGLGGGPDAIGDIGDEPAATFPKRPPEVALQPLVPDIGRSLDPGRGWTAEREVGPCDREIQPCRPGALEGGVDPAVEGDHARPPLR